MSSTTVITQTKLETAPPANAPRNFNGPVKAEITFGVPPSNGETPFNYVDAPPAGQPQRNVGEETRTVEISDIRGREDEFTLDKHSFRAVNVGHSSKGVDFTSDESIQSEYYPEVEALLLKEIPGSHKVVIFDHTVRRQAPDAKRAPVLRAHVDQTARSAAWRVPLHVPDAAEAERLLAGRYRIVNVWRPLTGPVESFPLAVADSSSTADDFVFPVEHRYPHRTGETAAVRYSPDTRWYYLGAMRTDERLFLQCFDSVSGARTPHTGFVDPRSTPQSRPRESIEVRALVFG